MTCKTTTDKQQRCTVILQEIHEMMTVIIATGNDTGMSALDIVEDCIRVMRLEDDHSQVVRMSEDELMLTQVEGLIN